jgi:hypothetical protein
MNIVVKEKEEESRGKENRFEEEKMNLYLVDIIHLQKMKAETEILKLKKIKKLCLFQGK